MSSTIALDVRFKVRSGGSTYITQLLPHLLEQGAARCRFVLVRYADQVLEGLPADVPSIEVPALSAVRELAWMHRALPRLLRRAGVDLYHGMKLFGPANAGCPLVHTAHSTLGRDKRDGFPLPMSRRLYFGVYGAHMFRRSRHMIAVSQFVADYLAQSLAVPAERITVIPNGLDERYRAAGTPATPTDRPYILCVGNVFPVKNHRTALRAYAAVAGELPHDLVIAGDDANPLGEELRNFAASQGLAERVRFLGFTEHERLIALYRGADVLLHPSLTEGFGITALEAMACGVPVVASEAGALREVCGEAGRFVADAMDADGFAGELREVLADEALRRRMSRAGVARAAEFSWSRIGDQTLAVYEQCLG